MSNFGDSHNRLETPVLIPNTEVKLPMLVTVVAEKLPNHPAVFHLFFQYFFILLILYLNMKKVSKIGVKKQIEEFFKDVKNKTLKDIKKIKKLAMKKNIPLKEKRKLFCKKCFSVYHKPRIRIKNKIKSVKCENCNYISRWKI